MHRLVALLLGTLLLTITAPAAGAVPVGATGAGSPVTCSGGALMTPRTNGPATTSTVPGAGVLTSISYAATAGGTFRAVLFGPGDTPTRRAVRGYTDKLVAAPNSLNTYPVRIPVAAGTTVGLWIQDTMQCAQMTTDSADSAWGRNADPTTTPAFDTASASSTFTTALVDISAVWEPDADGDGYGDTTQDPCPQAAASQTACTPDTVLVRAPKAKSTKRLLSVAFSATVTGSTFTCKVDGAAARPCGSPFKKKYERGRHTVVVTAVGPYGQADPTPVTVTFKVKRPRHH